MNKSENKPRVSIIAAAYNREKYLKKSIESVLSQTYQNWELLIMDDHSSDRTAKIASRYAEQDNRIRHIRNERNLGISKNRNKGLREARGEYIAVLDADDYWIEDEKLEQQLSFLENNPEYTLVGSDIKVVNEQDEVTNTNNFHKNDREIRKHLLLHNQFVHSSVVYKKEAALSCNGYDETLEVAEDYKLWLCLGTQGKLKNINMESTAYRVHSEGATVKKQRLMAKTHDDLIEEFKNEFSNYWLAKIKSLFRIYLKPLLQL